MSCEPGRHALQAVFLLIGKTSALTMNIAGVIKDWMLIFFSFYLFHAPVTAINLVGYAFCCSGVAVYNWQKLQVIKRRAQQKAKEEGPGAGDEERTGLISASGAGTPSGTPKVPTPKVAGGGNLKDG